MTRRVNMTRPFNIEINARSGKKFVSYLRRQLLRLHPKIKHAPKVVSIVLVGDQTMAKLHVQFMGIKGPTDVLTFPIDLDSNGYCTFGEIIICVPEATRRAEKLGINVRDELLLYALHGLLHLSGLDDRTPTDYQRMHALEDQLLSAIGVGRVFDPKQPRRKSR